MKLTVLLSYPETSDSYLAHVEASTVADAKATAQGEAAAASGNCYDPTEYSVIFIGEGHLEDLQFSDPSQALDSVRYKIQVPAVKGWADIRISEEPYQVVYFGSQEAAQEHFAVLDRVGVVLPESVKEDVNICE